MSRTPTWCTGSTGDVVQWSDLATESALFLAGLLVGVAATIAIARVVLVTLGDRARRNHPRETNSTDG